MKNSITWIQNIWCNIDTGIKGRIKIQKSTNLSRILWRMSTCPPHARRFPKFFQIINLKMAVFIHVEENLQ